MRIIIICFAIFFFISCKDNTKPLQTLADFRKEYKDFTYEDLTKREIGEQTIIPKILSLDESYFKEEQPIHYMDTLTLLPLETTDECLISKIDKVIYQNKLFYVFDKDIGNLFVFHEDGRYKCKIGTAGRAPREYLNLFDFCVSRDGVVYLLDNTLRKILVFDSEGNFRKDIVLKHGYVSMVCSGNHIFLTSCAWGMESGLLTKNYRIDQLDLEGNQKEQLFPFNPQKEDASWRASNLGMRVNSDGHFIYIPYFGNQVFLLDSLGKLKESYLYQMGTHGMPPYLTLATRNRSTFSDAYEKYRATPYSFITNAIELDDYFCTDMNVGPCIVHVVYNKNTHVVEGISVPFSKETDIIDCIGRRTLITGGMPGNILIGSLGMFVLKIIQKVAKEDHIALGEYDQMITAMDESDNPVLVLIKVKTK